MRFTLKALQEFIQINILHNHKLYEEVDKGLKHIKSEICIFSILEFKELHTILL